MVKIISSIGALSFGIFFQSYTASHHPAPSENEQQLASTYLAALPALTLLSHGVTPLCTPDIRQHAQELERTLTEEILRVFPSPETSRRLAPQGKKQKKEVPQDTGSNRSIVEHLRIRSTGVQEKINQKDEKPLGISEKNPSCSSIPPQLSKEAQRIFLVLGQQSSFAEEKTYNIAAQDQASDALKAEARFRPSPPSHRKTVPSLGLGTRIPRKKEKN